MKTDVRDTRGQAFVLTVLFMVGLLGISALVLDVGSWFRASRASQAAADAAALAGAQNLPGDPASASSGAVTYANKNGGGVAGADVTITSGLTANDTITVQVKRSSPSFFAQLFGIGSANLSATATARTDGISQAKYVAPIGVPQSHPDLSGGGCPCFGDPTTLDLGPAGAPGAFHLINLDLGASGTTGSSTLSDWIENGFNAYLGLGGYFSDTGAKWNSSGIQNALQDRIGTDLLFPVYDAIRGNGSNASYHVIGWVGFHLTGVDARGSDGDLKGYFTKVIWEGIQVTSGSDGGPDYGVRSVQLIN